MPPIEKFKGLDKIALRIVGERNVNDTAPRELVSAVLQYWTGQSNTSAIFATVLSSITIALFVTVDLGNLRYVSAPFFVGFLYFAIRAWAFNRCARIAVSLWK